jgi:Niemann-Pick C1 protein
MGALHMTIQNDPQKLWVAPTSTVAAEQTFFDDHFGPFFRIEQLIFHFPNHRNGTFGTHDVNGDHDLIAKPFLAELGQLQHAIASAATTYRGERLTLDDLCFRPIPGKGCLVESPMQYWRNNISILNSDPDIKLTIACQTKHALVWTISLYIDPLYNIVYVRI